MDDFYKTRMGKEFFDRTVPDLVRQIARLNEQLERLMERLDQKEDAPACPTSHPRP